jgi:hypothetical protein
MTWRSFPILSTILLLVASWVYCQTIPQEKLFRVRLVAGISTRNNVKGDKIAAIVLLPDEFKGDLMEGVVHESKSSGKINKESALKFSFHTLHHRGETIPIRANVVSFYNSKGQKDVDEEGQIVQRSRGVGKAVATSALGAALGAAVGGARGAAIGAGAGLAAGLLIVSVAVKGPNISFDTNSELELSVKERSRVSADTGTTERRSRR